ncbi:MAG: hypothetical protein IJE78_00200 [Bacteroidaceae bacterium]|nr:hypothetical protein [Bacteroidaceae bacterium]
MNIAEILKRQPSGTKLYSVLHGSEVEFVKVDESLDKTIIVREHSTSKGLDYFFPDGSFRKGGECMLFPSKDKREWKNLTLGLKPFDRVLAKELKDDFWEIEFFSDYTGKKEKPYMCLTGVYEYCIPYEGNEKYLGKTENPK